MVPVHRERIRRPSYARVIFLVLLSLPISTAVGTSAGAVAATGPEYRIGLLTALTGVDSLTDFGIPLRHAADLAAEDVNAGGSAVRVHVISADDMSSVQAVAAARMLMDIEKVPVIIAGSPAVVRAIAPMAATRGVLIINCCAAGDALPPSVYTFRSLVSDEEVVMRYFRDQGYRRVAMLLDVTGFSRTSRQTLEVVLPPLGMRLVHVVECQQGIADYRGYVEEIQRHHPDVWYLSTFPDDLGAILGQARQSGLTVPVASVWGAVDPAWLARARGLGEGLLVGSPLRWDPARYQAHREFASTYRRRFNAAPTGATMLAYDTVRSFLPELIQYLRSRNWPYTGESLRRALDATRSVKGRLSGTCTFTDRHACQRPMAVLTVRNGELRVLKVVSVNR